MEQWHPLAGGLFQLERDGIVLPITSYVDRSLSRQAQLDQLELAIPWLPEQVVAAAAEQILAGNYQAPADVWHGADGRLFAPGPVKLTVLLAPGDAQGPHPLRPYLWPVLDRDGDVTLDPDETEYTRTRIKAPPDMHYAESVYRYVTSHRIAVAGKLALPSSVRSDYHLSLGLISPNLMEGFAAVKALGRIGQNKKRRWAHHVRYEWLTSVTCRTTKRAKKKFFGGTGPVHISKIFQGEMRYSSGKTGTVTLNHFHDERLDSLRDDDAVVRDAADFQANLERCCTGLGLGWEQTDSTIRDIVGGTEGTETWSLDANASYSFPSEVLEAR